MFDIGASELLMIVIVAVVVIGPKDLPLALRTAGRWIGKMRRMSNHFRSGIETMIREAELEEMEKKWREQNAAIMAQNAQAAGEGQTPEAAVDQSAAPAPAAPAAPPAMEPLERGDPPGKVTLP
jgi:sec-independent protein translocase protein TatB